MGNGDSKPKKHLVKIKINSNFTKEEVQQLFNKFRRKYTRGYMTKEEFIVEYVKETRKSGKGGFLSANQLFKTIDINENNKMGNLYFNICT